MSSDVSQSNDRPHHSWRRWHGIALLGAGFQCLVWGVYIILWPVSSSLAYGFARPPVELFLWQGTGLVIVLFGIGYVIASTNPLQHWLIVLIGLLGKSLGPVGMTWSVYHGQVSSRVLYLIPINDLVWLVPFGLILLEVRRSRR
jgi:small multidrug resistance pump